jgi:plasmid stability protein
MEADMGQVLVRNLDDQVIEKLKHKAELKGHSLEQELREVITAAAPLSADEKLALSKKLRSLSPPLHDVDIRAAIRHGRDDEFDN